MTLRLTSLVLLGGCDGVFGLSPISIAPPDAGLLGYQAAVIADHPAAYFRLDETAGGIAVDQIGGGPIGTYLPNVMLGAAGALRDMPDSAISLDGMQGAVDLGDAFDFAGLAPMSVEVWMKPHFTGVFRDFVSKVHEPPGAQGWDLYTKDADLEFSREGVGGRDAVGLTGGAVNDVYSYVVVSFDGALLRMYVDGIDRNEAPAVVLLPDTTLPFLIGANHFPTQAVVLGSIDEVAVYDYALPADRIAAHYKAAGY